MENAIKKSDWETYENIINIQSNVTDTQMALCELYEIITGGASNG